MFMSLGKPARATALAFAVLLSACGGGGDHHSASPPDNSGPPGGSAGPSYDLIPLGIPGAFGNITRQGIANGGIVAGTSWGGPGGLARAFLYNGSTQADLGTLGGAFAQALAVNRCGQVSGWSQRADGQTHAFLYDGAMHDLGTLGGSESAGNVINNCGKIAGWAVVAFGRAHAFLYDGTRMQDLGTLGGTQSYGLAINNLGQVAGQAFGPGDAWYHAFLYDSRTGGPMRDLHALGSNSLALDINDAGQVVGRWTSGDPGRLRVGGFYYEGGVMRDVGTLGGDSAEAIDINESGIAIGNSTMADGADRGFVYDGKTMTSIGSLGGSRYSEAVAINNGGMVVGASTVKSSGEEHAISWTAKEGIVDLNDRVREAPAGLVLVRALAVADDGNIAVRTNQGLALLKLRH